MFRFFKIFVSVLATMMLCERSMAEVYEVGDEKGWTIIGSVDYQAWAASKTFHVGDTIVFKYNNKFHDVMRVSHKNYNACNATGAFETFTSGNDSFVIRKPRTHLFFICSFPGHCEAGQKVNIRVTDASVAPTPSPTPVPEPYPSPEPGEAKKSESTKTLAMIWLTVAVVVACYFTLLMF